MRLWRTIYSLGLPFLVALFWGLPLLSDYPHTPIYWNWAIIDRYTRYPTNIYQLAWCILHSLGLPLPFFSEIILSFARFEVCCQFIIALAAWSFWNSGPMTFIPPIYILFPTFVIFIPWQLEACKIPGLFHRDISNKIIYVVFSRTTLPCSVKLSSPARF